MFVLSAFQINPVKFCYSDILKYISMVQTHLGSLGIQRNEYRFICECLAHLNSPQEHLSNSLSFEMANKVIQANRSIGLKRLGFCRFIDLKKVICVPLKSDRDSLYDISRSVRLLFLQGQYESCIRSPHILTVRHEEREVILNSSSVVTA